MGPLARAGPASTSSRACSPVRCAAPRSVFTRLNAAPDRRGAQGLRAPPLGRRSGRDPLTAASARGSGSCTACRTGVLCCIYNFKCRCPPMPPATPPRSHATAWRRACRRLERRLTRIYDDALRAHGLTGSQLALLVATQLSGKTTPAEVGRRLDLEKSTVSRNLARLASAGLVDVSDGLRITPRGAAAIVACHPAWRDAQRRAREALHPARRPSDRGPAWTSFTTTRQLRKDDAMNDTSSIRQPRTGDEVTRTLLLLAGWFFFAIWLGLTGTLNQHGAPPIGLGAAILLPLAVFVADRRLGSPLFGGLVRLELPALIALQTFRIGRRRVRRRLDGRQSAGRLRPPRRPRRHGHRAGGALRRRRRHPPAPASPRARADLEHSRRGRTSSSPCRRASFMADHRLASWRVRSRPTW